MFKSIKKKLINNKTFLFWNRVVKNQRKREFRDIINGFGGPDVVLIKHPGRLYPDKLVYSISNSGGFHGFFSEISDTLKYLYYAEIFHSAPVVYWREKGFYQEEKLIHETDNVFEYYYQPVSQIECGEIDNCCNVIFSKPGHRTAILKGEKFREEYQDMHFWASKLGVLYHKYCKLNLSTREYIDSNIEKKICKKRTLGVHIRGTDFKRAFNAHPICILAKDFVEPTKKMLKKYDYEQVFLATDSLEAIEVFRKEFGELLVFYGDIQRSEGNISLHCIESDRENHHYLLGLEVLRDAYTLSACNSLVAGMSQVSLAAQYIKIAEGFQYEEVTILDHGINHNGNDANKYFETKMK